MKNNENNTITLLPNEIFRPIEGYEKRYEISNYGRVKSLATTQHFTDKRGVKFTRRIKDHIITNSINNSGYATVILYDDNHHLHGFSVQRLVAKHFLEDWNPTLDVDHIDRNKLNNMASNLRMVTKKMNMMNTNFQRGPKEVHKYDDNGKYVCTYKSVAAASRDNHINGAKLSTYLKGMKNINIKGSYQYATTNNTPSHVEYRIS